MTLSPASIEEIAPTECECLGKQSELMLTSYFTVGRLQGSVFVSRRARAFLAGNRLYEPAGPAEN